MTTLSGLRACSTGRINTRSIAAPAMKAMAMEMPMAATIGRPKPSPSDASFQVM